jgi:hypothetical protein
MEASEELRRAWWKARPEEWALLCGKGDVGFARKWAASLGIAGTVGLALTAVVVYPADFVRAYDPSLLLAAAGATLVLNGLAWRGKAWALPGLMAVWTLCMAVPNLAAWRMPEVHWGDHPAFWMCRTILCPAAWVLVMRVLTVAYRLERADRP